MQRRIHVLQSNQQDGNSPNESPAASQAESEASLFHQPKLSLSLNSPPLLYSLTTKLSYSIGFYTLVVTSVIAFVFILYLFGFFGKSYFLLEKEDVEKLIRLQEYQKTLKHLKQTEGIKPTFQYKYYYSTFSAQSNDKQYSKYSASPKHQFEAMTMSHFNDGGSVTANPVRGIYSEMDVDVSPFDRNMSEIWVPGKLGILKTDEIAHYYRKLSEKYLLPFTNGIHRTKFFDVLKRRTYATSPLGASKGVQSIMIQIVNNRIYIVDPNEVSMNSKAFYRSRINEIIWILSKLGAQRRLPNTEFVVTIHDCVQTVSKPHKYRVATYIESKPVFTIVGCNFSDNIPFPMWDGDEARGGGYFSWNMKMVQYSKDNTPWAQKKEQAVFRGASRISTYFQDKADAELDCDKIGRGFLMKIASEYRDLLNVSISGSCKGDTYSLERLSPEEHHQFKYALYMEGNCFWADRINRQVFGPSVIFKQETPCGQFFEPLLAPYVHYIPIDFYLSDFKEKISWAKENDIEVRKLVRNANDFARNFLTLEGIMIYIEVILKEYTDLLILPNITLETSAIDVTDRML